jgi:hypothetical protein
LSVLAECIGDGFDLIFLEGKPCIDTRHGAMIRDGRWGCPFY